METLGLAVPALGYACIAVLLAAFVRGLTGFGSSLLWVSSLTLVLAPAEVVPMVLLFEVAASAALLPAVWRQVHWRSLAWVSAGMLAATPFGVTLLLALSADGLRLLIGLVVVVASLLLWRGPRASGPGGTAAALATGLASGLLNGSTAAGGPPVVLFYFAGGALAAGRASVIAYFLLSDALGAGIMASQGLVSEQVLWRWTAFLPLVGLGIWLGHRRFLRTSPELFRRFVLALLTLLGAALIVRAVAA